MTVNEMLAMLQDELEASKKAMFNSKRLVDADKCLDLIDEIVEMLPVELERAANIIKERKQILSDAESEAQQYLEEARRHVEDLVQETEIVKAANVEANGIIASAKQNAKEIRLGAKAYANEVLQDLESYLDRINGQIRSSREQFTK